MKMMPPIVGVPRLTWCDCGPSSRMNWPHPMRRNSRMNSGVRNSVKASDNAPAVSSALTRTILPVDRRDVQPPGALPHHDELGDAEPHGQQPDAVVLFARELAELAHLAEHRDR